ncbi:glycine--tRNA ligase [Spirochaeta isovalerica]|uniref:Glycine--tRNA ligase n=1 Tax=Spirochaeta isovalerica TaxID=150 RepID=A0A841R1N5_9SPIO|nr:glycine--tRNA ligase [Spirochaeta isovalerica]MBB6478914.1 glycyl-tRNA synthetase [Spirochaeta isovalerica]
MAKNKKENANTKVNEYGASMEKIVSLCKRRGFVYPSSEIYGGLSATWDYGPLGSELKNNIQKLWWNEMTRKHDNIVGLDAAIMMHPRTWEASGHVENFSDPLVDCKQCKTRFREDKLEPEVLKSRICPECGGELTEARQFNLMFSTQMGPVADSGSIIYLRPETAQGIFVNFKNVVDTSRVTIPFGIAQVGKAFRNEITTKNFIFRTCEFEQMEMQFFVKPGDEDEWFEYWKKTRMAYYDKMGINSAKLRFHQHGEGELAHYAKDAYDIEYEYPFGWEELEGIHSRTDFDLGRHSEYCGKEINYLDPQTNERYIPYVIETSAGLTRSVLIALMDAYHEENLGTDSKGNEDVRTVLHFHPNVAPVTVAVLPLVKKDGLAELAKDIQDELRDDFTTFYDKSGAIGRRYRRQDEIGTPFCITVDYESKDNNDVTLRFRDSMEQIRVPRAELSERIRKEIKNYRRPE